MKRNTKKRFLWIGGIIIVALVVGGVVMSKNSKKDDNGRRTVKVERKTNVEKALAVGSVEPLNESAVKSKVSGSVGKMVVESGDFVERGKVVV